MGIGDNTMIKEIKRHGDNAAAKSQERDKGSLSGRVMVDMGSCVNVDFQKQMPKWDTVDKDFTIEMPAWKAIRKESKRLQEQ